LGWKEACRQQSLGAAHVVCSIGRGLADLVLQARFDAGDGAGVFSVTPLQKLPEMLKASW